MFDFHLLLTLYPVWLPIFLVAIFWNLWVNYVRSKFFLSEKTVLLEFKIPRDIFKTPLAMEVFLDALYDTGGERTFIDRYWMGKTRPWFSLEIASLEGKVKFFIWTRASWKNFIESQLYAQYPGIEVVEVPDYAKTVVFDKEKHNAWGCDFILTEPDPYPIKTYVDYNLDNAQLEEESKTDPITNVIEFLGTMGKNEQMWIQIIIRAHKKEKRATGGLWRKKSDWKDEAEIEIKKITSHAKDAEKDGFNEQRLTSGEKDRIKALERSIGKTPFDCGIRAIYLADRAAYRKTNEPGLRNSLKQFSSPDLNSLVPDGKVWLPKYDYPWQDYQDRRHNRDKRRLVEAYKRRSFFYPPYQSSKPFILNSEELATIFHFPGKVSEAPTFDRLAAKKAEPPANLPI